MITLDSFSPTFGLTIGGTLVEILGSGFAPLTTVAPVPGELAAAPPPSVRVRFGDAEAQILAQTETRLLVRAPAVSLSMVDAAAEVDEVNGLPTAELDLDIVVENLDGFGNYMVARGSGWLLYERFEGWWFEVGDVGELPNSRMVGTWIIRLPDLPTPTAAQEG